MIVFFISLLLYTLIFFSSAGWKILSLLFFVGLLIIISLQLSNLKQIEVQTDKVVVCSRNDTLSFNLVLEKKTSRFIYFPVLTIQLADFDLIKRVYGYRGQKLVVPMSYPVNQRGIYHHVNVCLKTNDIFYFFTKQRQYELLVEWVVLPKLILGSENLLNQLAVVQAPIGQPSYEIKSYRAYVHGDSMKQVDWKLSSKHQEIIVKEYDNQEEQPPIFVFYGQTSFYFEEMLDAFYSIYQLSTSMKKKFYLLGDGVTSQVISTNQDFAMISKSMTIDLNQFLSDKYDPIVLFIPERTKQIQILLDSWSQNSIQIISYQDLMKSGWQK